MVSLSVSSKHVAITFSSKVLVYQRLPNEKLSEERVLLIGSGNADKKVTDGATLAVCSDFSCSGKYFAAASGKQLVLWETVGWTELGAKDLIRAASSVAFTSGEDRILLADKSGDAYVFKTGDLQTDKRAVLESENLLGHVSMLLRIASSYDDRYVITTDRDEKIRVSCLPNAYNIKTYCLGHTDAVTCINMASCRPELLISGSSDGTVRYWEFSSGKLLLTFDCSANDEKAVVDVASLPIRHDLLLVCVLLKKKNFIRLLLADFTNSCTCRHLEDVPTPCTTPLSLAASGSELFVLSIDSPHFVTVFTAHGLSLKPCPLLNDTLVDRLRGFNADFIGVTENDLDDRLFTHLNKRKIDDTQEYYKRKHERLLGCNNAK